MRIASWLLPPAWILLTSSEVLWAAGSSSPDRQPIAWVRVTPVETGTPDGFEGRVVTDISPDGQWVFYSEQSEFEGITNVWRIRTDGTGREQLTLSEQGHSDFRDARTNFDGSRVVFRAGMPGDVGVFLVFADTWLLDIPSGTLSKLTNHGENGLVDCLDISWDGHRVAWVQVGGIGSGVYLWDDLAQKRLRVNGDVPAIVLYGMSADGSLLAFEGIVDTPAGKRDEVFVVHVDENLQAGTPQRITFLEGFAGRGDMDDFGEHIVFTFEAQENGLSPILLYHVATDGSDLRLLAQSDPFVSVPHDPRLDPEGRSVLVEWLTKSKTDDTLFVPSLTRIDLTSGQRTFLLGGLQCAPVEGYAEALGDGPLAVANRCFPLVDRGQVFVHDPHLPNLKVAGDLTPGSVTSATIAGAPHARALLFAAAHTGLLPQQDSGSFLLDPDRFVLLAAGELDDLGLLEIRHLVPETLPFGGDTLLLQAWVSEPEAFTNVLALPVPP